MNVPANQAPVAFMLGASTESSKINQFIRNGLSSLPVINVLKSRGGLEKL
jgi:hypothetical protein